MDKAKIKNPKTTSKRIWYSYYAGYSQDFVNSVIDELHISNEECILDPWNGSGTTTSVATQRGIQCIGFDINPVTIVIAKSRLATTENITDITNEADFILNNYVELEVEQTDPLLAWFPHRDASFFRYVTNLLLGNLPISPATIDTLSVTHAFLLACLFSTAHSINKKESTKNPTWIKSGCTVYTDDAPSAILCFHDIVKMNCAKIGVHSKLPVDAYAQNTQIKVVSSTNIPLTNGSVNHIITSPPYCTRIDYAISTRIELAILGFRDSDLRQLRDRCMGTSTIHTSHCAPDTCWGEYINGLLSIIDSHPSYASSSYYYKTYWQYFNDCYTSLKELSRVLCTNGTATFVVQDSYYKDLHIDLARAYIELGEILGLSFEAQIDFPKNHSMVTLNRGAKHYSQITERIESVIIMRKKV